MWICKVDRIQRGISKNIREIATTRRKFLEEQLDNVRLNTSTNRSNLSQIVNNDDGQYIVH
jgi:hypothetical protein